MARLSDSPHSSDGVSLKDVSPETNITTYSPEDNGNGNATTSGIPSKEDTIAVKPFSNALSTRLTPVKSLPTTIGRSLTPSTAESSFTIKGFNSLFDPFVDSNRPRGAFAPAVSQQQDSNDLKKLSATAKDFHPNQLLIRDSVPDIVSSTPYAKQVLKGSDPLPQLKPVLENFAPLFPKTPSRAEDFGLQKHSPPTRSPLRTGPPFSTDGEVRHYVYIGNISLSRIFDAEIALAKAGVYSDMTNRVSKLVQPCELFLVFDDLRAAEKSHDKAVALESGLTIKYLTPLEFGSHCPRVLDDFDLNLFAGQVHFTAQFQGKRDEEWDRNVLRRACEWLAGDYGEIRSFAEFRSGNGCKDYRVEFFKLSAARRFFEAYKQGQVHEEYLLTAQPYVPSCAQNPNPQPMSRVDSGFAAMVERLGFTEFSLDDSEPTKTPQTIMPTPPPNHTPYGWFWSPTGRTRIPRETPVVPPKPVAFEYPQRGNMMNLNGQGSNTPRSDGFPGVIGEPPQAFTPNSGPWASSGDRDGPHMRFGPRGLRQEHANGHHNTVNIDKIANGTDVRTTVMLRNIPNKMHLPDLKKFVDRSSYGKYDFIYLRIDFQNDCNVGYAFINFENSESIINFMLDINNKRWDEFRSWKVAEVSYATIQGKDCLIQKFRNSSVMKEFDGYRPKLYYTESDPQRCGQEASFPEPDNWSKVKRSVDNAQHIGLFPPRAGQQTRDEQRRRRSQFDRGTPRAQLEESYDRRGNCSQMYSNDRLTTRFGSVAGRGMYQF